MGVDLDELGIGEFKPPDPPKPPVKREFKFRPFEGDH